MYVSVTLDFVACELQKYILYSKPISNHLYKINVTVIYLPIYIPLYIDINNIHNVIPSKTFINPITHIQLDCCVDLENT